VEKRSGVRAHFFEAHPVMGKALPLSNWRFVIDPPDSFYKHIIEGYLAQFNALLLRLLGLVASLKPQYLHPPVLKRGDWERSKVVPFHGITVFGASLRNTLQESEEVDPTSGVLQACHHRLWIVQEAVLVSLDGGYAEKAPANVDISSTNC